jgi:hypothetical protein
MVKYLYSIVHVHLVGFTIERIIFMICTNNEEGGLETKTYLFYNFMFIEF